MPTLRIAMVDRLARDLDTWLRAITSWQSSSSPVDTVRWLM